MLWLGIRYSCASLPAAVNNGGRKQADNQENQSRYHGPQHRLIPFGPLLFPQTGVYPEVFGVVVGHPVWVDISVPCGVGGGSRGVVTTQPWCVVARTRGRAWAGVLAVMRE